MTTTVTSTCLILYDRVLVRKPQQSDDFLSASSWQQQEGKKHPFSRKKPPAKLKAAICLDHLGIERK